LITRPPSRNFIVNETPAREPSATTVISAAPARLQRSSSHSGKYVPLRSLGTATQLGPDHRIGIGGEQGVDDRPQQSAHQIRTRLSGRPRLRLPYTPVTSPATAPHHYRGLNSRP
jgi:hypothetical protein